MEIIETTETTLKKLTFMFKLKNCLLTTLHLFSHMEGLHIYDIYQTPYSRETYLYTTEQLRVNGLAQRPSNGSLACWDLNSQPSKQMLPVLTTELRLPCI